MRDKFLTWVGVAVVVIVVLTCLSIAYGHSDFDHQMKLRQAVAICNKHMRPQIELDGDDTGVVLPNIEQTWAIDCLKVYNYVNEIKWQRYRQKRDTDLDILGKLIDGGVLNGN